MNSVVKLAACIRKLSGSVGVGSIGPAALAPNEVDKIVLASKSDRKFFMDFSIPKQLNKIDIGCKATTSVLWLAKKFVFIE